MESVLINVACFRGVKWIIQTLFTCKSSGFGGGGGGGGVTSLIPLCMCYLRVHIPSKQCGHIWFILK